MAEEKYVFPDDEDKENGNKVGIKSKLDGILQFVWNTRTREFLGRDGMSWAKVSLFYGVFYLILGGFFIGMLSVFFYITPRDRPTYFGVSSVMNSRTASLNPGLGFRPQIDPEDYLIKYNPLVNVHKDYGLQRLADNLKIFLKEKYTQVSENVDNCDNMANKTSDYLANQGKSCKFDYEQLFKESPCTEATNFGYKTPSPCVLVKLNKIVSWKPETKSGYISIKCNGEHSFDVDNIHKFTYYSENDSNNKEEGKIAVKYFPFNAQKSYRSPFVWVKVDVNPNVLVNIECKAYADNIEIERVSRRGLTKFALYLQSSEKNKQEL